MPLLQQALLWASVGSFFGVRVGRGRAGPTWALENSGALGTLRKLWGELLRSGGGEVHPCPTGSASLSLDPKAEAYEEAGSRQHLEPWGQAGCPASSLEPC